MAGIGSGEVEADINREHEWEYVKGSSIHERFGFIRGEGYFRGQFSLPYLLSEIHSDIFIVAASLPLLKLLLRHDIDC
jgi:hypothetical protein